AGGVAEPGTVVPAVDVGLGDQRVVLAHGEELREAVLAGRRAGRRGLLPLVLVVLRVRQYPRLRVGGQVVGRGLGGDRPAVGQHVPVRGALGGDPHDDVEAGTVGTGERERGLLQRGV